MIRKILFSAFLLLTIPALFTAQTSHRRAVKKVTSQYPKNFTISKADFDSLFNLEKDQAVNSSNVYLAKSVMLMNSRNGDIRFLRLKLRYFKNAFLMIQVNGEYSTQIFILSDDKSVFYKGAITANGVVMTRCSEDDIVSE
jgi:hypothetical protein